jgi:hypothetical protein
MVCDKKHSEISEKLAELPKGQGGNGRHKCAGCAYEKGYKDAKEKIEKIDLGEILNSLDDSQAGEGRHKNAEAAYIKGYYDGLIDRSH